MSYKEYIQVVPGEDKKDISLFTLSTCIWCKKTKALLKELGLEYSYVDVDLLVGQDQEDVYNAMWKFDSSTSFPMIIIDNGKTIIQGFDEEKIRNLK